MAYRNAYRTQNEFDVIRKWNDDYEGFVVGFGYTWMNDKVIMPANQNGWSPISQNIPIDESFHTITSERQYDTSQYAYEKSFMQDQSKVVEKLFGLIVKNKGNNVTELNLGNEKQYLPTDNSEINIEIKDTGSRNEIKIVATDKSNGITYKATYDSLTDFLWTVRDSQKNLEINKEGFNFEGVAGLGLGIVENAGSWAEKIMNDRGKYLAKQNRFGPNNIPPIVRSPLGNIEVPSKVMSGLYKAGKILGGAGLVLTGYQIIRELQNGRYAVAAARLAVAAIAYKVCMIPYVGWALAIGIGVADYVWGDEFYDWIDDKASELEMWWHGVRLAL